MIISLMKKRLFDQEIHTYLTEGIINDIKVS